MKTSTRTPLQLVSIPPRLCLEWLPPPPTPTMHCKTNPLSPLRPGPPLWLPILPHLHQRNPICQMFWGPMASSSLRRRSAVRRTACASSVHQGITWPTSALHTKTKLMAKLPTLSPSQRKMTWLLKLSSPTPQTSWRPR